jgi:hypothetical protein
LSSRKRMEAHEAQCFRNPARRACQTCANFSEYNDSNGMEAEPQLLERWHVRECLADGGPDLTDKRMFDCPLWKRKGVTV